MTESDLYTAYLLGCEDECIPEPKTFEQFIGEWRENSIANSCPDNHVPTVVGEKSGRSVLSESSPVDPREAALLKYGRHLYGCGGGNTDSLSGLSWEQSKNKWRDCTCGFAAHMREGK